MSEELIQRNLLEAPEKMGFWNYYNIGSTSLKSLKGAKIIPNRDYDEFESKKPDALICKKPLVIAAVEYKQPKELKTPAQIKKAILQELGTAQALNAKIYIVTDGTKTFWINPLTWNLILNEDGTPVSFVFSKDSTDCVNLINKIMASIDTTNDTIKPAIAVDPLPLAEKVWQDLWAVSGATPENCLYTFVEIFIFKYLSDLGVLKGIYSFSNLLVQYADNDENEVLEFYASTVRVKIKELFPGNPKDHTTIINGTIFVSKDDKAVSGYATVFKRILFRFKEFGTLENIDYDFKSKLFETFLKESISKKNWGQYFTPLKVVRSIVDMADIVPGIKICDPACGVGKFLLEPILHELYKYYTVKDGQLNPQISLVGYDKGFDKDEQKTIILAKANMLIYMSSLIKDHHDITTQFAKLFNDTFLLQTNSILGTLANPVTDEYDLILTNPPYVMSGSSNLKDEIAKSEELKKYFSVNAMGIEGLFMEWIVRALKPGGKAFIVVPDGIMNRGNDKRLRDFILDECIIEAIISLPTNTFFTTNKKTYILAITKKNTVNVGGVVTKEVQSTPVFTYLCSEIGETRDVYRFDIEQNDLEVAATFYNMFKGAKQAFTTADKRCKIFSIDTFRNSTHWSIDRWWTSEEKIELGVEDEVESVNIDQFITLLQDVSSSIIEYQEPLRELEKKNIQPTKWRTLQLTNEKYFEFISKSIGKNRTILNVLDTGNEEDIPVFTAGKDAVAFIKELDRKEPIFASTDKPVLSFATNGDGSAGRNFIIHTRPFYINTDRIALRAKDENIVLRYIQLQLLDMKQKYGFNHSNKANYKNLAVVKINLPCLDDGQFDLNYQKNACNIMHNVFSATSYIADKIDYLSSITMEITTDKVCKFQEISLGDEKYFDLAIGKRLLKKDFVSSEGTIPAYSANVFVPFAYVDSSNISDFNYSYVIWGIDGNFDLNVIPKGTQFASTDHCGTIRIKDNDIPPYYVMYELNLKKQEYGFDRGLRASLQNIQTMKIRLPQRNDGTLDYEYMEDIAQKYDSALLCRNDIVGQLKRIMALKVSI